MNLKAENVSKAYYRMTGEANYFYAVKNVNLELQPGAITVLMGKSGSGKTTLLHMLAGLLSPTEGKVTLDARDLYALDDQSLSALRNREIGVVPQGRSALDTLTVMENILLPQALYGRGKADEEAAKAWMERLDILPLMNAYPAQLSGGELRRMAIARAMAMKPGVLLADEPTGDLDDENTKIVLSAFREKENEDCAILIVTHEEEALPYADQCFKMNGGEISEI